MAEINIHMTERTSTVPHIHVTAAALISINGCTSTKNFSSYICMYVYTNFCWFRTNVHVSAVVLKPWHALPVCGISLIHMWRTQLRISTIFSRNFKREESINTINSIRNCERQSSFSYFINKLNHMEFSKIIKSAHYPIPIYLSCVSQSRGMVIVIFGSNEMRS